MAERNGLTDRLLESFKGHVVSPKNQETDLGFESPDAVACRYMQGVLERHKRCAAELANTCYW